ncbi:hypothetical protein FACS1894202_06770 [Clostridia bacterium]|nr:hypothetical protein FACS1894202_06770 [Clostridia bacterium]
MLPNFKPVAAVVIISGVALGGEAGFLVGAVTGLVSNVFFGQGPWTPWQMFAYGIIGFLAGVLFHRRARRSRIALCVYGALAALLVYGLVMDSSMVFMYQTDLNLGMFLFAWLNGLPFNLIHAAATAFFLFVTSGAMLEKLDRIRIKYGFNP